MSLNGSRRSDVRNLFSFSILSATVGVAVGFIMMVATLYATLFVGTQNEQITNLAMQDIKSKSLSSKIEEANRIINQSEEAADFSVFAVWSLAGLLLYALVSALMFGFKASRGAAVAVWFSSNDGRVSIVEEIVARAGLRIVGVLGIYFLYRIVFLVSPYLLVLASEVRRDQSMLNIAVLSGAMFVVGLLLVYLSTIMLRLIALRTRIFL